MGKRQGNRIMHASGGTAVKGASTHKLTLPSTWRKVMGITDAARQVELSFDGSAITTTRYRTYMVSSYKSPRFTRGKREQQAHLLLE